MDLGISVLLVIASICQVSPSGLGNSLADVDSYQKKCQLGLISCYEKSFPHVPRKDADKLKSWEGSLKECVKNR